MTIVDRFYGKKGIVGVIGHRGARATHPENTLDAFRYAIECGADAVELDVVVTTDGELAVTHDPVYAAFADLDRSVPKLEDVLELAAGNEMVFDIEMKECGLLTPAPDRYAEMVVERLGGRGLEGRAMVRSFEHSFLRAVHALRADVPLIALIEDEGGDWVEVCGRADAQAISPRFGYVSPESVARSHLAGLAVIPWTANDPAEWDRLIAAGVDAIVTDDPAGLVRFCRQDRYCAER